MPCLRGPDGRGGRGRAPPDPLAQPGRVGLQAQQAGRVGKHRPRVRLGEALALQELEEDLGVAARHVGIRLTLGGLVAEVAEAIDHLLGRAATDPELQPAAGDEIGRPGVLGHVERVLVAHVDDGRCPSRSAWSAHRRRRGAGKGRRADARSGGRGSTRHRRRALRPRRPARSTGAGHRTPNAPASTGESDQWPNDRNPMRFIERRVSRQRPAGAPLAASGRLGPAVRLATRPSLRVPAAASALPRRRFSTPRRGCRCSPGRDTSPSQRNSTRRSSSTENAQ